MEGAPRALLFYVSSPRQLLWKKRPHTGRNGPLPFVLQKFVRNDVKLRERVDATNVKKRSKKGVL